MTRTLLPIVVGAVLGALVSSAFLTRGSGDDQQQAGSSAVDSASAGAVPNFASESPDTRLELEQPLQRTEAGLRRDATLDSLTNREFNFGDVEELAATLPTIEAVNFRIAAIVALAERDTRAALDAAVMLAEPEQRRLAMKRLAQSLAERNPLAAIAELDSIDAPPLQATFLSSLLGAWAIVDPDRALGFLESPGDVSIPGAELAFDLLAHRDSARLLEAAEGLAPDVREQAITAALEAMVEVDPLAALAQVGRLPPGAGTSTMERTVVRGYGEQDPVAAWRWANESGISADLRLLVLAGIQSEDPDYALDLMMAELTSADQDRRAAMRQRVNSYFYYLHEVSGSDDIVPALDRMLAHDASLEAGIQQFIGTWSRDDPEAALDWALQNIDRIESGQTLTNIGRSLARTNAERVRQALFQLPEQDRVFWVTGVGRALAENDLAAARSWAFEFPRGPLRDAALYEYLQGEAYGGAVDTQLFDQFDSEATREQAASRVAFRLSCDGHTALATEIASAQIADPDLLAMSERQIETNARTGPNTISCMIRP